MFFSAHNIILIACFFSMIPLMLYLLYRRSALSRLASIPGEIVICEEHGVAVDEKRIRYYRYGKCLVRLTDCRIIIAQKLPLSRSAYMVRFVIDYHASEPVIDIAAMIKRGYVEAGVAPEQVSVSPEGAGASVSIDIRGAGGATSRLLSFSTRRTGEYRRVFPGQK